MFASEIREIIETFPHIVPHFLGVFASDELQRIDFRDFTCAIVNLDPSTSPGSHWICLVAYDRDEFEEREYLT